MVTKAITPEERTLYNIFVESSVPSKKRVVVTEDQKIEAWGRALEAGVNPKVTTNIFRDSPANIAIYQKLPKLLKTVLEDGVNPNIPNNKGMAALHMAVENDNDAAIDLLLIHGADIHQKDLDGKTALDYARERYMGGSPILDKLQAAEDKFQADSQLITDLISGKASTPFSHDPMLLGGAQDPAIYPQILATQNTSSFPPRIGGGLRGNPAIGYQGQGAGFGKAAQITGGVALVGGLMALGAKWLMNKFSGRKRKRPDNSNENPGIGLDENPGGGSNRNPGRDLDKIEEGRVEPIQKPSPTSITDLLSPFGQVPSPAGAPGFPPRALFPSSPGGGAPVLPAGDVPPAAVDHPDGAMNVDPHQPEVVHHGPEAGGGGHDYGHDGDLDQEQVEGDKKRTKRTPLKELHDLVTSDAGKTLAEARGLRSASQIGAAPQFNIGSSDSSPKKTSKNKGRKR